MRFKVKKRQRNFKNELAFWGAKGRSSVFSENLLMYSKLTKQNYGTVHYGIRVNIHAALTSVLSAIWLTIDRNTTLTLRIEVFRSEILLSKGKKTKCSFIAVVTFSGQL